MIPNYQVKLSAVGDISFVGDGLRQPRRDIFEEVKPLFSGEDLVIGNLECALTFSEEGVPGKCNLKGDPDWSALLRDAGINVLSLANNHIMDYGEQGLFDTIRQLDKAGLSHVGAGRNLKEAEQPFILETSGKKIAILARSSVIVSTPIYATDGRAGVAFLDENRLIDQINALKQEVDTVVLVVHWGLEEYHYPNPGQRRLARRLVSAGADIILGHHPHVLQGMEKFNDRIVAYSLGNFIFDNFNWAFSVPDQEPINFRINLSEDNRESTIFKVMISNGRVVRQTSVMTRIGEGGKLELLPGAKNQLRSLSRIFSLPFYNQIWKIYSLRREWDLRLRHRFGLQKLIGGIWKIRPRHVKELAASLRRSARITTEKSTNPYE